MSHEQVLREELIRALRRELIGPEWPASGTGEKPAPPPEILQESPVQRYSAGVLFPARQPIIEIDESDEDAEQASDEPATGELHAEESLAERERDPGTWDRIGDAHDEAVRLANEFLPSAVGMSFIVRNPSGFLEISARAATYHSQPPAKPESRLREWHRTALDLKPVRVGIPPGKFAMENFELAPHLQMRVIFARRDDGAFLVTVSMLNTRTTNRDTMPSGADCFFQIGFEVRDAEGGFVFEEYRPATRSLRDPEDAALELIYRNRRAYAVGHGCAAEWGEESAGRTRAVATATVPAFKVAPVEPRTDGGDELSMFMLSGKEGRVDPSRIAPILENLPRDYEQWIAEQETRLSSVPEALRGAGRANLDTSRKCLERIRTGIALLKSDARLLKAFMLANRAMLLQQYHSRRSRRLRSQPWEELPPSYEPTGSHGRWRPFQLAFILMNLRSLVATDKGEDDEERKLVDLIWFPTGGGKTEAYLGLSACDIFLRRLKNPRDSGCTVIMRYTLRLLTAQQFQRASSLICACEVIRRESSELLGDDPISIGLWVGESLTPIWRHDAVKALNDLSDRSKHAQNPFQLLKCPWCGTALDVREEGLGYLVDGKPKTVIFVCPESRCPFSRRSTRLPVLVIDEDIYDAPPTLLIGTVDKFAMLAWRDQARSIFGLGESTGTSPPDLIIQDELHLISGPLGSVVGLYESAIDMLCSTGGRAPKIIASTATIRRATQQCQALYDRPTSQFPPQGLDISDSFFAAENPAAPGRIYTGVFATAAQSFVTAMVRTLSALFQYCLSTPLPAGASESVRDPYWTVLQYFNSLRELGHAATLVEADIPEYMWAIASRERIPKELCRRIYSPVELTSRLSADEIPEILEKLGAPYPKKPDDDHRPLDTLLATNMISVGVDIERLGLMVVVGQPKTTSEYIQASSRIGRSPKAPGLVVTMYNPGKPRDRSHYEHFRGYHSAFYKHVEPTSVTPFSLPVLERALHALLVIVSRQIDGLETPHDVDTESETFVSLARYLKGRCERCDSEHASALAKRFSQLLEHWEAVRPNEWGRFGRPPEKRPLMYPAGAEPPAEWDDSAWPTLTSMRNVDVECQARVVTVYPEPD